MTVVADLLATIRADSSQFQGEFRNASAVLDTFGQTAELASRVVGTSMLAGMAAAIDITKNWTRTMEGLKVSFDSLLGSGGAAQNHIAQVEKFANTMGVSIGAVGNMSRELEILTNGMHDTTKDWQNFTDIAAVTGKQVDEVSAAFARIFQLIQKEGSGEGAGRGLRTLVTQGFIPQDVANQVQEMVKHGATLNQVWETLTSAAGRFKGAGEDASNTMAGLTRTFRNILDQGVGDLFLPVIHGVEELGRQIKAQDWSGFINFWRELRGATQGVGEHIGGMTNVIANLASHLNNLNLGELKANFQGLAPIVGTVMGALSGASFDAFSRLPIINRFLSDFRGLFSEVHGAILGFLLSNEQTRSALGNLVESIFHAIVALGEFAAGVIKAADGFAPIIAGIINFVAHVVNFASHNRVVLDMAVAFATVYESIKLISGAETIFMTMLNAINRWSQATQTAIGVQREASLAADQEAAAQANVSEALMASANATTQSVQSQIAAMEQESAATANVQVQTTRLATTNAELTGSIQDVIGGWGQLRIQMTGVEKAAADVAAQMAALDEEVAAGQATTSELVDEYAALQAEFEELAVECARLTEALNTVQIAQGAITGSTEVVMTDTAALTAELQAQTAALQENAAAQNTVNNARSAGSLAMGYLGVAGGGFAGGGLGSMLGGAVGGGAGSLIGGVLGGAGMGALFGSILPGPGTAVGAGIGAITGLASALVGFTNHAQSAASAAHETANAVKHMNDEFNRHAEKMDLSNFEGMKSRLDDLNAKVQELEDHLADLNGMKVNVDINLNVNGNLPNLSASGGGSGPGSSGLPDLSASGNLSGLSTPKHAKEINDTTAALKDFHNQAKTTNEQVTAMSNNINSLAQVFGVSQGEITKAAHSAHINLTEDFSKNKDDFEALGDALHHTAGGLDKVANSAASATNAFDALKDAASGVNGNDFFTVTPDVTKVDKYLASVVGLRIETVAYAQEQMRQFEHAQALQQIQQQQADAAYGLTQAQIALQHAYENVALAEQALSRATQQQTLAYMTQADAVNHFQAVLGGNLHDDYSNLDVIVAQLTGDQKALADQFTQQLAILTPLQQQFDTLTAAYKAHSDQVKILQDQYDIQQAQLTVLTDKLSQYQDILNRPLKGSTAFTEQTQAIDIQIAALQRQKDNLLLTGMYDKDPQITKIDQQIKVLQVQRDVIQQTANIDLKPQQDALTNLVNKSKEVDFATALDAAKNVAALTAQVDTQKNAMNGLKIQIDLANVDLTTEKANLDQVSTAYTTQKQKVDALWQSLQQIVAADNSVRSADDAVQAGQRGVASATEGVTNAQHALEGAYRAVQAAADASTRLQLQDALDMAQRVASAYDTLKSRAQRDMQDTADSARAATNGVADAWNNMLIRMQADTDAKTAAMIQDWINLRNIMNQIIPGMGNMIPSPGGAINPQQSGNSVQWMDSSGAGHAATVSANGNIFYANGGFNGADFFARGAENHIAHITNRLRIFGEPETGGEAYIPLALSKRDRSMDILSQVASMFGFSLLPQNLAGELAGLLNNQPSTSSSGRNHVSFTISSGAVNVQVDIAGNAPDDIGQEIEAVVMHALDEVMAAQVARYGN